MVTLICKHNSWYGWTCEVEDVYTSELLFATSYHPERNTALARAQQFCEEKGHTIQKIREE